MVSLEGMDEAQRVLRPSRVHHLPVRIDFEGTADVDAYFKSEDSGQTSASLVDAAGKPLPVQHATFRGRKLVGAELALPAGVEGFVFEPRSASGPGAAGEALQRPQAWDCHSVFDSMTVWNFDRMPSDQDEMRRWADWLAVSRAVHS